MSSTHRIHATWLENAGSAGDFWSPLPNAEQFYVVSCYVSVDGWKDLEGHLRAGLARDPPLNALLIFSRSGIECSGGVDLLDVMKNFIDSVPNSECVDIGVIDDSRRRLFHPKAHASRQGYCSRVVVGSANLTRGGMMEHYEMGLVTENDRQVWADFESAILELQEGKAYSIKSTDNYQKLRARPSSLRNPSSPPSSPPSSGRQEAAPRLPLEDIQLGLFERHFPVHLGSAMELVSEFFRGGQKMSRTVRSVEFSTKIRLSRLQRVGIVEAAGKTRLSRNVSFDKGAGEFIIKLFPLEFEDKISDFKEKVGVLYGATTVSMAGITWTPPGWGEALRAKWKDLISELRLESFSEELVTFRARLLSQFNSERPGSIELKRNLPIAPPGKWNVEGARDLLEIPLHEDLPTIVTPDLRRRIAMIAGRELRAGLAPLLDNAYRDENFAHLSELPRPGGVFTPSPADIIDILAEISLLAVAAQTESGKGAKNAVAKHFAKMLTCDPVAEGLTEEAEFWKNCLSRDPLPCTDNIGRLFSRAWDCFRRWFHKDVLAPGYYGELPKQLRAERTPPIVLDCKRYRAHNTEKAP